MNKLIISSLTLLFLASCGSSSGSSTITIGPGTPSDPPSPSPSSLASHVQFAALILSGTQDKAATTTVNNQADQNPQALLWSVEQVVNNNDLLAGFEAAVKAVNADGSSERIITLDID